MCKILIKLLYCYILCIWNDDSDLVSCPGNRLANWTKLNRIIIRNNNSDFILLLL